MSFVQAVQTCFRKYAVFSGRATRSEFWWWQLSSYVVVFVLAIIELAADVQALSALFGLATLVPGLAVSIRRLHDSGRSAWNLLCALIPLFGGLLLLFLYTRESEWGDNDYGPQPGRARIEVA